MTELAHKVLVITAEYLGPASKVFLERQTRHHLNGVNFNDLEGKHLPDLSRWVNISAGLLIDKARALELSKKISILQ